MMYPKSIPSVTAGAFLCTVPAEFNETLAIKFGDLSDGLAFRPGRRGRSLLGAADLDTYFFHVLTKERDEIAEEFRVTRLARDDGFLTVNAALHIKRPFLGILSAKERLLDVSPLATDLGSPIGGI